MLEHEMNAVEFKSVNLRAEDDPHAGKLAETLHWVDFADTRKGRLQVSSATLGDVTLGDIVTDGYVAQTTTQRLTVSLPLSGLNGFYSKGHTFEAAGTDVLLIQPGTRKSVKRADDKGRSRTLSAIVPTPSRRMQSMRDNLLPPPVMHVGGVAEARSLRGFLVYIFTELRDAASPLKRPGASAAIEAMTTDLVHAICDAPMPLPSSDKSAGARVRAAREYMRAHADEALTLEQIAHAVGVGPRSLQAAFRDIAGKSPRVQLNEIRLENARARLMSPEPGTTVTNAALDCGFAHLGRFASAYRFRYGESPSDTLRRAIR